MEVSGSDGDEVGEKSRGVEEEVASERVGVDLAKLVPGRAVVEEAEEIAFRGGPPPSAVAGTTHARSVKSIGKYIIQCASS